MLIYVNGNLQLNLSKSPTGIVLSYVNTCNTVLIFINHC